MTMNFHGLFILIAHENKIFTTFMGVSETTLTPWNCTLNHMKHICMSNNHMYIRNLDRAVIKSRGAGTPPAIMNVAPV